VLFKFQYFTKQVHYFFKHTRCSSKKVSSWYGNHRLTDTLTHFSSSASQNMSTVPYFLLRIYFNFTLSCSPMSFNCAVTFRCYNYNHVLLTTPLQTTSDYLSHLSSSCHYSICQNIKNYEAP